MRNPQIIKTNKLEGITEVVCSLDINNLENGSPSYTLLTYHVTAHKDSVHFEPYTPQYKKCKKGEFISLALRMTHKENNITNGLETTVVFHIQ